MRVLFDNIARDSEVSATNENLSYPAENLIDVFFDRPYISSSSSAIVTIDAGEDVEINSVYIGECNAAFATVWIEKDNGTVTFSKRVNVKRKIESVHFTTVKGRYVYVEADVTSGISAWKKGVDADSELTKNANAAVCHLPDSDDLAFRLDPSTLPELPDGTAVYRSDWSTVDEWSFVTLTPTLGGGYLDVLTTGSASGGTNYMARSTSIPAGSFVVMRMMRVSGTSAQINLKDSSGVGISAKTPDFVTGEWKTVVFDVPSAVTGLWIQLRLASAGEVWRFGAIYIGDGTYLDTTKALDTSANALSVPARTGWLRDSGASGYALRVLTAGDPMLTASQFTWPDSDWTLRFRTWDDDSTEGSYFSATSSGGMRFFSSGIYFSGSTGATSDSWDITSLVSGAGVWKDLALAYVKSTKTLSLYRDGALVGTHTNTNAMTCVSAPVYTRSHWGSWLKPGKTEGLRIDSRALSAAEIRGLYSLEVPEYSSTVTESPDSGSYLVPVKGRYAFANPTTKVFGFVYDSSVASKLKIKAIAFGLSEQYAGIISDYTRSRLSTSSVSRSVTGQVSRNKGLVFREYEITIPLSTTAEFREIDAHLMDVGTGNPVYFDISEDTAGFEDPIYAEISDGWNPSGKTDRTKVVLNIKEAR